MVINNVQQAKLQAAYQWAADEMKRWFPHPDHIIIKELDKWFEKYNTHLSIFKDEHDNPVILRVYWIDDDTVKYSIIENYEELHVNHTELITLLERNGLYAFEQAKKAEKIHSEPSGKLLFLPSNKAPNE